MVQNAVDASRPLIEETKHLLHVDVSTKSVVMSADPVRLVQILSNLLNNTAKYTEEGGEIWLKAHSDGQQVEISVRDTGVGIPADMLSKVFDLFTQVDRTINRAQGGLGIGLTLVRTLVESQDGHIEAKSAGRGRGSEFIVTFPTVAELEIEEVEQCKHDVQLNLPRTMVVDDNIDSAQSLGALLEILGAEVAVLNCGLVALESFRSYEPSVMLIDIGMPGMDGNEVARQIRTIEEGRNIVLIALTGWGQDEDRRRSREAGFDHHLVTPVDIFDLEKLLNSGAGE